MPVIHAAEALTPEGWRSDVRLTIEGDAIAAAEFGVPARAGDERHAIALPAMSNLHSHAFQRGMAGLAEYRGEPRDTFWTWRETMYRFALTMSPEDVEAVAAQLYVEMLEAGFAAVAEFHYLHHAPDGSPYAARGELASRIVAASRTAGIGLTLLPVFYAHGTFGGAPPKPEQRRFLNDVDSFARLLEDSRALMRDAPGGVVGVAPHSLRAVAPAELSAVVGLAGAAPIHIHAAEQVKEVEDCLLWSGSRPVQWLLDHAAVDSRWCFIHATHMNADETRRLARSGAVAGLCPITEANLGDGVFNAPDFIADGGLFGVGSDSNVFVGVAAELRQLEYAQRLRDRARNVCASGGSTGRALYDAALAGGARALARPGGRLAAGALGDIVTLCANHPALAGRAEDQILDAWIFSGGNPLVDCVWSGGRKVVAEGRHVAREAVAATFAATMRKLCGR
jgi:formiminoglutamate deiminase